MKITVILLRTRTVLRMRLLGTKEKTSIMKNAVKLLTAALLLGLLAGLLCLPAAAASGKPSETVTVLFAFSDAYGASGGITYSNPDLFSAVSVSGNLAGAYSRDSFSCSGTEQTTVCVYITATVRSDAKVGESCVISTSNAQYVYNTAGEQVGVSRSETVTVESAPIAPTEAPKPTAPTEQVKPAETEKPTPSDGSPSYSELLYQIGIAERLDKAAYTSESWAALQNALDTARHLTGSRNQNTVNAGASALANAIAALQPLDFTKLHEALDSTDAFLEENALNERLTALIAAQEAARAMLTSGSQEDIDAAADALTQALEAVHGELAGIVETVEVPVEVPTEVTVEIPVEPTTPYCNMQRHTTFTVLLWVSVGLNAVLIAVGVIYAVKRRRNTRDTTPLVDYEISDDD